MKKNITLLLCVLITTLFACNDTPKHTPVVNPIKETTRFDCNILTDKDLVLDIADSILEANKNDFILSDLDTTGYFTVEDYFTNTQSKDRLVLIGGVSGSSSGTSQYMMMLLSCTDSIHVVWAGQTSEISNKDIKDLNGDGIKEIICKDAAVWMGERHDIFSIINFKGGDQNILYEAHSISYLDAGNDHLVNHDNGDTLETNFKSTLLQKNEKEYYIHEIHTVKLKNGGANEEELIKNLNVVVDSSDIALQ